MELQTVQAPWEEIPEHLCALSIMGRDGDTKHIWNPKNEDEIEAARTLYESLVAKGYRAFRLTRLNRRGKKLDEFVGEAGRAVFVAPRKKKEAGYRKSAKDDVDGEQQRSFEPRARATVLMPQYSGG